MDYLVKPVNPRILRQKVAIAESRRRDQPAALAVESREIRERPIPVAPPEPPRVRRNVAIASALPDGPGRWIHFAIGGVSSALVLAITKVVRKRRAP